MVLCVVNTDDPLCGRQPRQESSACPRGRQNDAGGSSRTQRRPRHRGLADRGQQARPEGLHGGTVGQGGRCPSERSAALTTRPIPGPVRAAEDRPVSRRAYFPLNVCISGTAESTDAIFILAHPLSPVRPDVARPKGNAKENL